MGIACHTSSRLVLTRGSWSPWILGTLLLGVGLWVGLTPRLRFDLSCDRTSSDLCQMSWSSWLDHKTQPLPMAGLRKAVIEPYEDSEGDTDYEVVLLTDQEYISLGATSDPDYAQQEAAVINQFIQMPSTPLLHFTYDQRWAGLVGLIFFGGMGLTSILSHKIFIYDFDKTTGQFTFIRQGVWGATVAQFSLSHLSGLRLEEIEGSAEDGEKPLLYRPALVFRSGASVPLDTWYTTFRLYHQKNIERLAEFLGRPVLPDFKTSSETQQDARQIFAIVAADQFKRQAIIAKYAQRISHHPHDTNAYEILTMALLFQGDRWAAKTMLETGRSRCQQRGETDQALRLEHLLYSLQVAPQGDDLNPLPLDLSSDSSSPC